MFSVTQTDRGMRSRGHSSQAPSAGFVLPRPLRKPVRFAGRVLRGNVTPPRFASLAMAIACIGGFTTYGAVLGGYAPTVAQAVTARTGFAVDEITVTGNKEISEIDVLDQLELTGWTSLVGFDASAARDRISKLAWVENASVRKVYPDKIEVDLLERKPFAVWQYQGKLSVVEPTGQIITATNSLRGLPMIVGLGAPEVGEALMEKIATYPELSAKVASYIRVANRRWDLKLTNGVTIRLPEEGVDQALGQLAALDKQDHLLSRDIASVDMRIADRITVALTDSAQAALEAQQKTKVKGRT